MSNKIRHEGVIDSIDEGCVHVRILQTSACAACKVAGYCNAAEAKEKIVDVFCNPRERELLPGQPVTVSASGAVAARYRSLADRRRGNSRPECAVVIDSLLRTIVSDASSDAAPDGFYN